MRGIPIIVFFISMMGYAQHESNFIVVAEDSTRFILELDGVKPLDSAHYNVKVVGIKDQSHQIKLTLVDHEGIQVEKALYFQEMNVESTMKLVLINGEYKLRYFGEVSMGAAPLEDDQVIVEFEKGSKSINAVPDVSQMSRVEAYSYELENASLSYASELSINSTAGHTSIDLAEIPPPVNDSIIMDSLAPMLDSNKVYQPELLEVVYNYNGEKGCSFPDFEVETLVGRINEAAFSSQKIKIAKKGVEGQCLTTDQVELIANTLEFEDNKLSFIKHAYAYTYDKQNYKRLLKLLNFSNTKSDFLEFINA